MSRLDRQTRTFGGVVSSKGEQQRWQMELDQIAAEGLQAMQEARSKGERVDAASHARVAGLCLQVDVITCWTTADTKFGGVQP